MALTPVERQRLKDELAASLTGWGNSDDVSEATVLSDIRATCRRAGIAKPIQPEELVSVTTELLLPSLYQDIDPVTALRAKMDEIDPDRNLPARMLEALVVRQGSTAG